MVYLIPPVVVLEINGVFFCRFAAFAFPVPNWDGGGLISQSGIEARPIDTLSLYWDKRHTEGWKKLERMKCDISEVVSN